MATLKGLVIGLAILILIAMALLTYGLATGAGKSGRGTAPPAPKAFGEINLGLPAGCAIVGTIPDGRRLYLTVGPAGTPCRRIIVIDVEAGAVLGTILEQP